MFKTNFPFYPIMILLSLIANIIIVIILSQKYNFTKKEMLCLLLYENVGIITGAKILTYLQNYKTLKGNVTFLSLGLSAYGAVIGAILFLILFSFQFKKSLKEMLYIFMPSIPLMYAIGKIGCFLVGCCHGIKYNGFGKIIYNYSLVAPPNTPLFPIQITETICFLGIFVYMIIKHLNNTFNNQTLGISFILCGITKFGLDFLRFSHIGKILSSNQLISLFFILIGIIIFKTKQREE